MSRVSRTGVEVEPGLSRPKQKRRRVTWGRRCTSVEILVVKHIPSGYGLLADSASHRKELKRDEKVLIDAKDCAAAQLFVLGILECQNLIISNGCLLYAWSKYQKLPERQRQQAAILLTK
jgi:hypothetical protein